MKKLLTALVVLVVVAAGLPAQADYDWTGAGGDGLYTNTANWTGTATDNNFVDNGDTVVVDAIVPWNANDLKIGTKGSETVATTGRVDIVSGSLSANFWTFLGDWTGNATLNIADTSSGGGTYTGYGQGSGSYTAGAADGNGNIIVGLYKSSGLLNMNTTGSLNGSGLFIAPNNQAGSGTFNLDSGTVNVSGDMAVGSDFWGSGTSSDGHFNMSGGEVNVGGTFRVGVVNNTVSTGTSDVAMTGGILRSAGDVVVGFAGLDGVAANMTIADGARVDVGTAAEAWLQVGQYDETDVALDINNGGTLRLRNGTDLRTSTGGNTGTRVINVDGGSILGTAGSEIVLGEASNTGTDELNISTNGLVSIQSIRSGGGSASSTVNIDYATIVALGDNPDFIDLGNAASSAVNLLDGGASINDGGFSIGINEALAGEGGLLKLGAGTLTLTADNVYNGNTTVGAGLLIVTGSLDVDSDVSILSGAAIGGSGTIGGNLDLASGAMLAFSKTSTLSILGSISLDSTFGVDDLVVDDWSSVGNGTYTLIDNPGDFSGIENVGLANAFDVSAIGGNAGQQAYFQQGSLELVVIPEPATLTLIGLFGAGFLVFRRRSRM